MAQITKKALEASLKNLLLQKPLSKITIQDKINANDPNLVDWTIEVAKGKRVKIAKIEFEGITRIPLICVCIGNPK